MHESKSVLLFSDIEKGSLHWANKRITDKACVRIFLSYIGF